EEIFILKNLRVIICLGKIAFDSYCKLTGIKGVKFSHGKLLHHNNLAIICSYHPSRQNTQTGRLTWPQWKKVFTKAMKILNEEL
ncbi:MAG: uracil-DNA glycosylase family protein, partial [Nitrosopumilaceae archaeon]